MTFGEGITGLKKRRLYLPTENKTTGATSEAGSTYPPGAHEFTPVFSGVHYTRSLVLYVCFVDRCPFVLFLLAIVLSGPLRYTDSDCPFGILKLVFVYATVLVKE